MPLLLATLSLFMLLLNLAMTWVPYHTCLCLLPVPSFMEHTLKLKAKIFIRCDTVWQCTKRTNIKLKELLAWPTPERGVKCLALMAIQQPEVFRNPEVFRKIIKS